MTAVWVAAVVAVCGLPLGWLVPAAVYQRRCRREGR